MADEINIDLINYLEGLSNLTLSDEEKQRLTGELQKILRYMERLGELDTEGVPERSHPFDNANVFRRDEVRASYDRELILQNAPDKDEEMYIAPRTVE